MKTSSLIGPFLDKAVALALNVEYSYIESSGGDYNDNWWKATRNYSSDWNLGGRLIEKEKISLSPTETGWMAKCERNGIFSCGFGNTMLVAGLRCFVQVKIGEEVKLPKKSTPR